MTLKLGMHTGPQNLSMEELTRLWRRADAAKFHWVSVWDHFYANPLRDRADPCFEGVAAMAALAAMTSHVRVGCLVFCALFRNPGLLAKAAATIDHISNGRAEIGIGAGWFQEEFNDFGYPFPPLKERLDQLEEAAAVMQSLFRDPITRFSGRYYQFDGAVCGPKPKNPNMRLWIGGRGEKRTPRLAARFAGGFNMPYVTPEFAADRLATLRRECDAIKRDPAEIDVSVNLHFQMSAKAGASAPPTLPGGAGGALWGSSQQVVDRLGAYERVGVKGVNIAFRPPIDWEAVETYIAEVLPAFHR